MDAVLAAGAGSGVALQVKKLTWKGAVTKVQAAQQADDATYSFIGDKVENVPSLLEERVSGGVAAVPAPVPPRLAVMIHAAHNLPGAGSSSSSSIHVMPRMYAKAAVHMPGKLPADANKQKTHLSRKVDAGVVWGSLLSLAPEKPQDMVLTIALKQQQRLAKTGVIWGVASLPLCEVLAAPSLWGEPQQLQLKGHRLDGMGATLEVQLFLSMERIQGPLSVLAATWNVGNAMPPAPEQLQDWLKGASESLHHLVAVGAQECNYTKDSRKSSVSHHKGAARKGTSTPSSPQPSSPPPAAAGGDVPAEASAGDSDSANPLPLLPDATSPAAWVPTTTASSAASVFDGTSKAIISSRSDGRKGSEAGDSEDEDEDIDASVLTPCNGQGEAAPLGVPAGQAAAAAAAAADALDQQHRPFSSSGGSGGEVGGLDVRHAVAGRSRTMPLKQYLLEQVDSAATWERHVAAALGKKYWLVGSKHMFQTRILLFARMDVVPYITDISTAFEATGIGHVGLNKGGVALSLRLDDTHLAFVSSHLAAHQSKAAQRNSDMSEICANIRLQQPGSQPVAAGADLATSYHHLVWMGDLNYRLEYGQQAETHAESPTPEDFAALCSSIAAGEFPKLLQLDQLRREQEAGRVFVGFSEGGINFAPTFKVKKGEPGFSYAAKRSPAWCDRVLVKSALPHKPGRCSSYFAAPDICTSDHKPVGAVLSLPLVTNTVTSGRSTGRTPFKLYIASIQLQGESTWLRLDELASGPGPVAGDAWSSVKHQKPKSRKLQLVLSGACMAGTRQQHVLKVDKGAVAAGLAAVGSIRLPAPAEPAAAISASLMVREESVALLPGAVQDLQDDWLLLHLVLVEGLMKRTLARGVVPLQPAVAEYQARTFTPVPVPVQLECSGTSAGSCTVSLQLISSHSARQAMYEAIHRMRTLAMHRSLRSANSSVEWHRPVSGGRSILSRTTSGTTLVRISHKVREGMGAFMRKTHTEKERERRVSE